ncbi:MAG: TlpA disulfide reductase family protein [Polyangiaceae bacterium]
MTRDRRIFLLALLFVLGGACKRPARAKEWPAEMTVETAEQVVARVRTPGPVTLFVIYASWCHSCRKELPMIGELARAYAAKGVRVVALSTDEDPQDFAEMLAEEPMSFPLLRLSRGPDGTLAAALKTLGCTYGNVIPYTALFDRTGALVKEWPEGNATRPALEAAMVPLL